MSAQPEIYIRNCTFGEFRGTMRLQSRSRTVVEDCVFANKEISLLFTGDTTYWYESGPVNNMTVRRCTFKNANDKPRIDVMGEVEFSEKEKYYHKNIAIEECVFEDCSHIAMLRHADNVVFTNNKYAEGSHITEEACGSISADTEIRDVK